MFEICVQGKIGSESCEASFCTFSLKKHEMYRDCEVVKGENSTEQRIASKPARVARRDGCYLVCTICSLLMIVDVLVQ